MTQHLMSPLCSGTQLKFWYSILDRMNWQLDLLLRRQTVDFVEVGRITRDKQFVIQIINRIYERVL